MIKKFKSYYWKEGKPYGREKGDKFKIVVDPYHKRYSIEEYEKGEYKRVIYDSNLLDFRSLKDPRQASWLKEPFGENSSLLRNQDDRVVLIEKYEFKGDKCSLCRYLSPQGIEIAFHKISLRDWGDPFDGVTLYDLNDMPIMQKKYTIEKGEFLDLLEENWNFSPS